MLIVENSGNFMADRHLARLSANGKYKIMFHSYYKKSGYTAFAGKTYNEEKFAILNDNRPRLYQTREQAESEAKRIIRRCSNLMQDYKIIDIEEGRE